MIINLVREATRWSEDKRGESAPSQLSFGRCSSFRRKQDLQGGTACSKVSGAAQHLGQIEGMSQLNHEGCAAR